MLFRSVPSFAPAQAIASRIMVRAIVSRCAGSRLGRRASPHAVHPVSEMPGLIAAILTLIGKAVDKAVPDASQANELKTQIAAQVYALAETEMKGAIAVILAEAQGESWLQRNWRPLLMLRAVAPAQRRWPWHLLVLTAWTWTHSASRSSHFRACLAAAALQVVALLSLQVVAAVAAPAAAVNPPKALPTRLVVFSSPDRARPNLSISRSA